MMRPGGKTLHVIAQICRRGIARNLASQSRWVREEAAEYPVRGSLHRNLQREEEDRRPSGKSALREAHSILRGNGH